MAMADRHDAAMIFDLDGTLADSVYQHVIAWDMTLRANGLELSLWRPHRRIGMSGGLFVRGVRRELGRDLTPDTIAMLRRGHNEAYAQLVEGVFLGRSQRAARAMLPRAHCGPSKCLTTFRSSHVPTSRMRSRIRTCFSKRLGDSTSTRARRSSSATPFGIYLPPSEPERSALACSAAATANSDELRVPRRGETHVIPRTEPKCSLSASRAAGTRGLAPRAPNTNHVCDRSRPNSL
jgi:hypothetical protein